jgi:uncharacterized membrane protein
MHGEVRRTIRHLIEWCARGVEVLAVAVIVAGVTGVALGRGTVRYLFHFNDSGAADSYKQQLGRPLLLGLELLVAGDVIRTVVVDTTLANVAVLGLLVRVRTAFSWSSSVELQGRWPWQGHRGNANLTVSQVRQRG